MNKAIKVILLSLLCVLMLSISVLPAFAAEDTLTVNGKDAKVGDTVTYALNISGSDQKIVGIQLTMFFDQGLLTLKTVENKNFIGATINENKNNDGRIYMVNSDLNGVECKETTEILLLTFTVKAAGQTEISYYIQCLYDYDLVNIYNYSLTCDMTIAGEKVQETAAPQLADISGLDGFDPGDFSNNVGGTGSGVKPTAPAGVSATAAPGGDNRNTVAASDPANASSSDNGMIIAIVCAGIIVAGIVVIIVIKAVAKKKDGSDT